MRGSGKFWGINRDEKRRSSQRERVSECRSRYQLVIQSWFSANFRAFFPLQIVAILTLSLVSLLRSRLN